MTFPLFVHIHEYMTVGVKLVSCRYFSSMTHAYSKVLKLTLQCENWLAWIQVYSVFFNLFFLFFYYFFLP